MEVGEEEEEGIGACLPVVTVISNFGSTLSYPTRSITWPVSSSGAQFSPPVGT